MKNLLSSNEPSKDALVQEVIQAVENFELTESQAWGDLDVLSTHTHVDAVEVDPAGVIIEPGDRFRGVANVYLLLQYGSDADDGFQTSEALLGKFKGHFDAAHKPVVEILSVDTSPFYG